LSNNNYIQFSIFGTLPHLLSYFRITYRRVSSNFDRLSSLPLQVARRDLSLISQGDRSQSQQANLSIAARTQIDLLSI